MAVRENGTFVLEPHVVLAQLPARFEVRAVGEGVPTQRSMLKFAIPGEKRDSREETEGI